MQKTMNNHIPDIYELVDVPEDLDVKYVMKYFLDEKHVIKHFLGRTREEARKMIDEEDPYPVGVYTEDLSYMATKGFSYYLPSFIEVYKTQFEREGEEYVEEICGGMLTAMYIHAKDHVESITDNKEIILDFFNFLESKKVDMIEDERYKGMISMIKEIIMETT